MADGSKKYTVRNDQGGADLNADGWDEMARLMEQATECTKRCAEALRTEGRHSVNFREAKRAWGLVVAKQMNILVAASAMN